MELLAPKKQTRVIMDSQILTALQLCEEFLNLRHNHQLVPISGPGRGIEMGAMMHKMLEPYYLARKEGKNRDDSVALGIGAGNLFITGCLECKSNKCTEHKEPFVGLQSITIEQAHEVISAYLQYLERWKNDPWSTVNVEFVKGKVIWEDDELSLMWKAKIDWEIDNNQEPGTFSVDHKTMSRREETLSLNNQFIGQCVVTEQNKMFINKIGFQSSLKPEEKFERQAISYSKARIMEWIQETASYAYDLVALQTEERFRHRFTSCARRYGDCIYRHVCEGEPSDRQRLIMQQFKVAEKAWDITNA